VTMLCHRIGAYEPNIDDRQRTIVKGRLVRRMCNLSTSVVWILQHRATDSLRFAPITENDYAARTFEIRSASTTLPQTVIVVDVATGAFTKRYDAVLQVVAHLRWRLARSGGAQRFCRARSSALCITCLQKNRYRWFWQTSITWLPTAGGLREAVLLVKEWAWSWWHVAGGTSTLLLETIALLIFLCHQNVGASATCMKPHAAG